MSWTCQLTPQNLYDLCDSLAQRKSERHIDCLLSLRHPQGQPPLLRAPIAHRRLYSQGQQWTGPRLYVDHQARQHQHLSKRMRLSHSCHPRIPRLARGGIDPGAKIEHLLPLGQSHHKFDCYGASFRAQPRTLAKSSSISRQRLR